MFMEVEQLLDEIDREIAAKGIVIPHRPMAAMAILSGRMKTRINMDDDLYRAVVRWYDAKYGKRLHVGAVLGRVPVVFGTDVFVLRLSPKLEKTSAGLRQTAEWGVEGGEDLWNRLDPAAREMAGDVLNTAYNCFCELSPLVAERALPQEATIDVDTAIDELVRDDGPRTGLSKWASLQVAEKCLKAFLRWQGEQPKKSHNLAELNAACVTRGLPDLEKMSFEGKSLIDHASCSPGIRYSEEKLPSVDDAVNSVHAALLIACAVAARMRMSLGGRRSLDMPVEEAALFITERFASASGIELTVEA